MVIALLTVPLPNYDQTEMKFLFDNIFLRLSVNKCHSDEEIPVSPLKQSPILKWPRLNVAGGSAMEDNDGMNGK